MLLMNFQAPRKFLALINASKSLLISSASFIPTFTPSLNPRISNCVTNSLSDHSIRLIARIGINSNHRSFQGFGNFPKLDFWEKLIFAGLGTHQICLLSANNRSGYPSAVLAMHKKSISQKRSFCGVSGHRICLLI